MADRVEKIRTRSAPELIWYLEHSEVYTAGISAKDDELLNPSYPVVRVKRGGHFTWHGPGQRIVYCLVDLRRRKLSPRRYVAMIEQWVIDSLKLIGINGIARLGRTGIWVTSEKGETKIAAIGIRISHGITSHGLSINISPDLSAYTGIIPCGIRDYGVTSIADLGIDVDFAEVDRALMSRNPFMEELEQ